MPSSVDVGLSLLYIGELVNAYVISHLGKSYDGEEDSKRKEIFSKNLRKVEIHNYLFAKGKKSYTMRVNEYTDLVRNYFKISSIVVFASDKIT